jgi:predicted RNase H-like HicB family nuclease
MKDKRKSKLPACEIIIYWSDVDESFIAEVPKLAGCAADGETYERAFKAVQTVMRQWIETAHEFGRDIPKPRVRLMFA